MKKLLELPVMEVFEAIDKLPVPKPITVQQGFYYLMFMQAISEELDKTHNDPRIIMLERIVELAKEHGGYTEHDLDDVQDGTLVAKMLDNSQQEMTFTRLTYLTARLLADKDSQ